MLTTRHQFLTSLTTDEKLEFCRAHFTGHSLFFLVYPDMVGKELFTNAVMGRVVVRVGALMGLYDIRHIPHEGRVWAYKRPWWGHGNDAVDGALRWLVEEHWSRRTVFHACPTRRDECISMAQNNLDDDKFWVTIGDE